MAVKKFLIRQMDVKDGCLKKKEEKCVERKLLRIKN